MAASIVAACFALNPNVLYLASIPLTEMVFLAGLAVLLFALLHFRDTQQRSSVLIGLAACWWISLTRYDGWFLIPFAALAFAYFAQVHRLLLLVLFGVLASLAPLYWMAHNYWESGDALFFYRGPYSRASHPRWQTVPGLSRLAARRLLLSDGRALVCRMAASIPRRRGYSVRCSQTRSNAHRVFGTHSCVLCLESAFIGHAHPRTRPLAVQLLQHALRNCCRGVGGIRGWCDHPGTARQTPALGAPDSNCLRAAMDGAPDPSRLGLLEGIGSEFSIAARLDCRCRKFPERTRASRRRYSCDLRRSHRCFGRIWNSHPRIAA